MYGLCDVWTRLTEFSDILSCITLSRSTVFTNASPVKPEDPFNLLFKAISCAVNNQFVMLLCVKLVIYIFLFYFINSKKEAIKKERKKKKERKSYKYVFEAACSPALSIIIMRVFHSFPDRALS